MRAALLLGRGGPEKLEVRDDVTAPVAGPDEVLIEVAACGVNNTDINTRVGWYSRSVTSATSGDGFSEARADDATWGRGGLRFPHSERRRDRSVFSIRHDPLDKAERNPGARHGMRSRGAWAATGTTQIWFRTPQEPLQGH